ncbi:DUF6894 family protein [Methylobacterium durans]|uniref:DUF6894 domain-containing protein n=1 Tax=Methylobacterium durans TaxID=2202825 RepID=A0A2U8WDJ5_9HYPH|nr:hypothetical protein [Methylobacterium durans]AWN43386.1 hypothetical protein DK389_26335 [Methylobacterium durans]
MPHYFIDLHDGAHHIQDKEGFEAANPDVARERVVGIMSAVAQGFQADADHQHCVAAVRDESGTVLFRARLSLNFDAAE